MYTYLPYVAALIAFAIGLALGMGIQRAIDDRRIRSLEGQRNDRVPPGREEMVAQEWCCAPKGHPVPELEARIAELEAQLVEIFRDDSDDLDYDDWLDDEAVLNWNGSHE